MQQIDTVRTSQAASGGDSERTSGSLYPKSMLDLEISPQETAERLRSGPGSLTLVDVREPWELEKAGIAGAKAIPMGEIPARAFQELDPDGHIVVVCHAGVRSLNVTIWMRNQGFERVQSLRGGIDAWSRETDPAVPRY